MNRAPSRDLHPASFPFFPFLLSRHLSRQTLPPFSWPFTLFWDQTCLRIWNISSQMTFDLGWIATATLIWSAVIVTRLYNTWPGITEPLHRSSFFATSPRCVHIPCRSLTLRHSQLLDSFHHWPLVASSWIQVNMDWQCATYWINAEGMAAEYNASWVRAGDGTAPLSASSLLIWSQRGGLWSSSFL